MTYGHFTARSAYAALVCEDVAGGGLLVFIKQARGSEDGEARITLAPDQLAKLRAWLGEERDADQCACPELHPGVDHAVWSEALAASEPGDIPLHLETQAEWGTRTTAPRPADRVVAYLSLGGRVLLCLDHASGRFSDLSELWPVTSEDLPDGGICTYPDCGADVLIPRHANGS